MRFEEFRRDHERIFWERVTADPRLTDRLARAELIAPVRGRGDLVNYMRVPAGPGWALVGDSGQHKDPLYGQGIGDAVRTARLLADHVVEALGGGRSFESSAAAFHEARDADLLPQYEWMIKGAPQGWAKPEFEAFLATLGEDPELSRQFVNLFSHGVMPQELFGSRPTDPESALPTGSLEGMVS
jgi:flavin-dependent dehydrogenase